jgi:two-component sensor histidine kinase
MGHLYAHDSLYVDSIVRAYKTVSTQNPAQGQQLLLEARKACLRVGYGPGDLRLRLVLANWESDYGSPARHLEILNELEMETRGNPDHYMRGSILHNLGLYHQQRGAYSLALEQYLLAKEFFERRKRTLGLATIYGKLAFIYKTQGNYSAAQDYYERAAAGFAELGEWIQHINTLHNFGFLYEALHDYIRAESLFVCVKELSDREHYVQGGYLGQFALAAIAINQGRYAEAETMLSALEQVPYTHMAHDRKGAFLLHRANLRQQEGRLALALQDCKAAEAIADQAQSLELRKSACKCLADAHQARGEYRLALRYNQDFHRFRDSLQSAETKVLLEGVRAEYDLEKIEKDLAQSELACLQEQNLRLEAEQTALNQKRVRIFVLVLLAFAIGFIAWFIHTNRRIQRKNRLIQAALEEKEVLLGEVHHRVKNNLQLISSIIDLQARNTGHAPTVQLLGELRNRIHAITVLHQQLYQQPALHAVRTRDYLPVLLENLRQTLSPTDREIHLRYEIDAFSLPVGTAITLGLIVSELVTNAYRHAFTGREGGHVRLLLREAAGMGLLQVEDDGRGMASAQENFGMSMIRSLVRQMRASIHIHPESGTRTEIQWQLPQ